MMKPASSFYTDEELLSIWLLAAAFLEYLLLLYVGMVEFQKANR